MNRIMTEYYPTFQLYQALRDQLMTILTDKDLRYTPGGANPPLGTLCRRSARSNTPTFNRSKRSR